MKRILVASVGAVALVLVMAANVSLAGNPNADKGAAVFPPDGKVHGMSLTDLMGAYFSWWAGGSDPAQNSVHGVLLMALPDGEQIGGSWTPEDPAVLQGSLEVTVPEDTPFILPECSLVGERYNDGTPDDPLDLFPDDVFLANVHPVLTIDGKTVMTDANKAEFYVPATYFDSIAMYPTPTDWNAIGGIWYQGIGVVCKPLPVGKHVIHLYEPYMIFNMIYDNTWTITVVED